MVRWGHTFATSTPKDNLMSRELCPTKGIHQVALRLLVIKLFNQFNVQTSKMHSVFFHIKYWEVQSTVYCTYYRHSAVALSVSLYISLSESMFFHYQRIEYWVGQSTVYRRRGAVARQSLPDIEYFGGWSGLGYHHCPPLWQGCTICQGNCKGELKNQNSTYFSGKPQDTSFTCKRTGKFCICSEW